MTKPTQAQILREALEYAQGLIESEWGPGGEECDRISNALATAAEVGEPLDVDGKREAWRDLGLLARLRYYRCGDKTCAEIAARAASEIERLRVELAAERERCAQVAGKMADELERDVPGSQMEVVMLRKAAACIRALKDKP